MNGKIFVVAGIDVNSMNDLPWKDGDEGNSLPSHVHDVMNAGEVICVDKRPHKIKFYRKIDGIMKTRCHVPNRTMERIVMTDFGPNASCKEMTLVPQLV